MMGILAKDPQEKEALAHLVSKEGRPDMRALIDDTATYADVMQMFPSAHMPLEYAMDFVPAIKPRLYSIASASEMHPDHIHLCIVEEDWENSKGKRHGQSTWFVRNNTAGLQWGKTRGLVDAPAEPFGTVDPSEAPHIPVRVNPAVVHLPDSPKTPLIMVGLGTGMAPFRSFIQQRVVLRERGEEIGPMLLYFGARYEKTEYLYGDEIEAYHADGILTDLKKAFSRDQEHKIYAQHRIEEDPHLLYDYLIKQEGSFYLCGPAGNMPAQMREAVIGALEVAGGHSREESEQMVTDMQISGRCVRVCGAPAPVVVSDGARVEVRAMTPPPPRCRGVPPQVQRGGVVSALHLPAFRLRSCRPRGRLRSSSAGGTVPTRHNCPPPPCSSSLVACLHEVVLCVLVACPACDQLCDIACTARRLGSAGECRCRRSASSIARNCNVRECARPRPHA